VYVCQLNVRHQAIGHDGCRDDRTHRNVLASRKPFCEHDAGYQDVLLSIMTVKGLDEGRKVLADFVSRRCQANMADLHRLLDGCCDKKRSRWSTGEALWVSRVVVHFVFSAVAVSVQLDDVSIRVADEYRGHVAEAERARDFHPVPGHKCFGLVE